jgi:tetratricopeptide (TPR) repeat protein
MICPVVRQLFDRAAAAAARAAFAGIVVVAVASPFSRAHAQSSAQTQKSIGTAVLHGCVRDTSGNPIANATVTLILGKFEQQTIPIPTWTAHTDAKGHYRFGELLGGSYALTAGARSAAASGLPNALVEVSLGRNEVRNVDFVLVSLSISEPGVSPESSGSPASTKPPEFFDEPQFTVAGVTQGTTYGGHGSDNVSRASEALVKETGKLGKESAAEETTARLSVNAEKLKRERDDLQSLIRRDENLYDETAKQQQASRHHQLAGIFETLNEPVSAVREYQRAAELVRSETHLFDWASELLTHRAPEPATEVFAQGNRLYPQSVRMLVGLGISWYARRSYERASQFLVAASDLAPSDPTPYLFMGKMEAVETAPTSESVKRLERFVSLCGNKSS